MVFRGIIAKVLIPGIISALMPDVITGVRAQYAYLDGFNETVSVPSAAAAQVLKKSPVNVTRCQYAGDAPEKVTVQRLNWLKIWR